VTKGGLALDRDFFAKRVEIVALCF